LGELAGLCFENPGETAQGGGKARNLSNIITKRCKKFHFTTDEDLRTGTLGGDTQEFGEVKSRGDRRKKKGDNQENRLAKLVSIKLEEGNYKGAVRLISSEDSPAPPSEEGLKLLQDKHPPTNRTRVMISLPSKPSPCPAFATGEVLGAVKSFPPGSSGGPDGLTPSI